VLERRRDTTVAILASTRDLNGLSVRLCPAADLFARGPYPPIFTGVGGSETPVEWRVFDRENG
jgi:hypothetical protein